MPPRASKRLKVAAETAVTTASAVVSEKKAAVVKKTSTRVTNAAKKTNTTTTTVVEETTTTTIEQKVEETTTKQEPKGDTASSTTAAWGALFGKTAAAAKTSTGEKLWPRPKRTESISDELKQQIDAFAPFDGVCSSSPATAHKIVAWNVNGLRALLKREDSLHFRAYVAQEKPDILCLSETKIDSAELQKLDDMLPEYEHQYWSSAAKKGYSGTAILSKIKPLSVKDELVMQNGKPDDEGRFLALEYDAYWLVHTYVPNAGMKLDRLSYRTEQWDKAVLKMLKALEETKPVVWCGDLNVAHKEIDLHNPKGNRNKTAGFTDAERESFSEILANGFVDSYRHFHPGQSQYSYWSYRFNARVKNNGWRIDYFVISKSLVDHVENTFVRDAVSGSDHAPVGLELKKM